MKKILVALFLMLIIGFGIVGYMQSQDPNQTIEQDTSPSSIKL
ncbi:hypothetical protein [Virgibacillus phasianinus]|nr:hypothetical protein [Virgibacillus phasianinus]